MSISMLPKSLLSSVFFISTCAVSMSAQAQGFQFDKFIGEVEKQLKKGVEQISQNKPAALGTVAGGLVGGSLFDNEIVGVVVGATAGAFIGNEIGKALNADQQKQVSQSTVSAVVTGEDEEWQDAKTPARGSVKVVATERKVEPVSIPVSKKKVSEVPPLDVIGETYEVISNANVRGGPETTYEKVGSLAEGTKVNVVGKVKDAPWYFISENGVGTGFLFAELAKPSAASVIAATPPPPAEETFEAQVADEKLCRTVEQSVMADDGTVQTETITACKGANGWEMQST